MVHGVFFRDFEHLNYWGRIPEELKRNGATIYYGNHNSASAVRDSARELAVRVHQIIKETGCEKLNIIAHSKGGLDSRAMIAEYTAGEDTRHTDRQKMAADAGTVFHDGTGDGDRHWHDHEHTAIASCGKRHDTAANEDDRRNKLPCGL